MTSKIHMIHVDLELQVISTIIDESAFANDLEKALVQSEVRVDGRQYKIVKAEAEDYWSNGFIEPPKPKKTPAKKAAAKKAPAKKAAAKKAPAFKKLANK